LRILFRILGGIASVGLLGFFVCAIVYGVATDLELLSGEEEARLKWDDCRKIFFLKARPAFDFLKTYSCEYTRSEEDGHITGGICVYVEGPFIGTGCQSAKIYDVPERKPGQKNKFVPPPRHSHAEVDPSEVIRVPDGYHLLAPKDSFVPDSSPQQPTYRYDPATGKIRPIP
jgi:hypothetical protein